MKKAIALVSLQFPFVQCSLAFIEEPSSGLSATFSHAKGAREKAKLFETMAFPV